MGKTEFLFEALEPRLLLSADLNAAAGHALLDGLSALDHSLASLASTTALTTPVPFVNRSVGDVAGLTQFSGLGAKGEAADPIAAVRDAAAAYLTANPAGATLSGLQGAFSGLQGADHPGVSVATSLANGAIDLTLSSAATTADASGATDAATRTFHLVFGVDAAAPSLQISTAVIEARHVLSGGTVDVKESWAGPLTYSATQDGVTGATVTPAVTVAPAQAAFAPAKAQAPSTSPILPQIQGTFNDFFGELNTIEQTIENAVNVNFDFPLIGNKLPDALNPHVLLAPIRNEISSLQTTVNNDFANSGELVTGLQADIAGALSAAHLLPGNTNPTDDVVIEFQSKDFSGTKQVAAGMTFNLENVTAIELDLKLGFHDDHSVNLTTDIGLPGLGLKMQPGSQLTASVDFTLEVGLGMTASSHYFTLGSGADTGSAQGSPINFHANFYLDNGFQAVGTIAFLQALLTEPNEPTPDAHTGLAGYLGLQVSGGTAGGALNGGTQLQVSDFGSLSAKPLYGLTMTSQLQLAFGVDFQKDPTTHLYVDQSDFPSLSANLHFVWPLGNAAPASPKGFAPAGAFDPGLPSFSPPDVALDDIQLDVGEAINKFISPIFKPIYDVTHGMLPFYQFLQKPMPIFDTFSGIIDNIPDISSVLPSYVKGKPYDWLSFAVDMAADEGVIDKGDAKLISTVGNAILKIIVDIDTAYSDAQGLSGYHLKISLGNLSFPGKDLSLPQFAVTGAGDLANIGKRIANFAGFSGAEGDDDVLSQITGLLGGSDVGSALGALGGAAQDFASSVGDALNQVNADLADDDLFGGITTTENSIAQVTFPFFDNPDSIIGMLFGQQVQFVNVDLGFSAKVTGDIPIFEASLFGILTAKLSLPVNLDFEVGLQFGYDSKGFLDFANNPSDPAKLLDGIYIGGDPLLKGTKNADDVLQIDATVGVELDASLLLGAVSAGIEGNVDVSFHAYLAGATAAQPLVHYDVFSNETTFDLDAGQLGPVDLSAQGNIGLYLKVSTLWGFGPDKTFTIAQDTFFTYPNPQPTPQDIQPLGFYHPATGEFDLYVGATENKRDNGDDALPNPAPSTPQQILENDSSTYVIDVNGDSGTNGNVTVHWYNPQTKAWESQTPSGAVKKIVALTGDGTNTIIVNNNQPNDVVTDFTGSGGVIYDPTTVASGKPPASGQSNSLVSVGGRDVFEAAGGNATLIGGDTDDILVGSSNRLSNTTPDDYIQAGAGPNVIVLNTSNANVLTGSGPTTVYAGTGNQTIHNQKPPAGSTAAQGDDTIRAGLAGSFLAPFGPGGDEVLSSGSGVVIPGGLTNQVQINYEGAGVGQSTYGFDGGVNTLDYRGLTSGVDVNIADGSVTGPGVGAVAISGINIVHGAAVASTISGGSLAQGADTIYGESGVDNLSGGPANDVIYAASAANPIYGNIIDGGSGNATIFAGNGADRITSGDGANLIWTRDGNDTVTVGDGANTIHGGTGNQKITAGNGANVIYGGDGDDIVLVGFGDNRIYAGDGPYKITAGVGDNSVVGGTGAETIILGALSGGGVGGAGANTVEGGQGDDVYIAGDGANSITGGNGKNTIYVGRGANYVYGGSGGGAIFAGVNWATATLNPGPAGGASVAGLSLGGTGANKITGGTGNYLIQAGDGANTIYGGVGADTIEAGVGANSITGGVGDDRIYAGVLWAQGGLGGTGKNTVYGGTGADLIAVGDGDNSVTGGAGNMAIYAGVGSNWISAVKGDDSLYAGVQWPQASFNAFSGGIANLHIGGTGANTIDGGTGNALIEAGDGANSIHGGQGRDTIEAGVGANSINGGVGDMLIQAGVLWSKSAFAIGGTGANTITGGTGKDTIEAGDGQNSITGGTGDDLIEAGVGANWIYGGHGNMQIYAGVEWTQPTLAIGGTGANTIEGGVGNTLIEAGDGANTIHGGQGDDTIEAGVGANTILGGVGKDFIAAGVLWSAKTFAIGGTGANVITGGSGNDTIYAGDGGNTIVGGTGDDLILAGVGSNSITGGFGDMTIYAGVVWTQALTVVGGHGANTIYGGTGNDFIEAGDGDNIIDGGIGDDVIISGFGDSSILGGTGTDHITVLGGHNVIRTGTGDATVTGGTGADLILGGDGDISVQGGAGNDTVSLGDGDNVVTGGGADLVVTVGDGNNVIHGGAGNSTIEAGAGNNLIFGGQGRNWIADGAGHATIQGGGGNDTIYGGALSSVIVGGQGDDIIVAGAGGGNILVGGAGDNTIQGGAGADTIYGGGGDNKLYSGGGADKIYGDHAAIAFALSAVGVLSQTAIAGPTGAVNARATIVGGAGADSLYGGAGADSLYGGTGTRLIVGGRQTTYIQGGAGTGVTIQGGDAGDVIIGSDGGHDHITGGKGNNRIELRGGANYASNGAGSGVIVGGEGDDSLIGGTGGQNTLIGGAASDVLTAASAFDSLFPDSGATANYAVTGDALSAPTVTPPPPTLPLPGDAGAQGWWSLVAGPAGLTLGGTESDAASPAIAADASGPWVAWTQAGGVYVAHDVNGVWTAVAGSTTGLGLSSGGSASNAAIALLNGAPVVVWTSTTPAGRTIEASEFTGGHWASLGAVSGTGASDHAQVVATNAGPVVTWRDTSAATPVLRAARYDGAKWVALDLSASVGAPTHYALASDGTHIAVAFSAPTAYGAGLTVLQSSGGAFAALSAPAANPAVAQENGFAGAPTLAYSGGSLFIAWTQQDRTTLFEPRLYAAMYANGAWSEAGTGAASGYGLTPNLLVSDQPVLASGGGKLTLVWTATELTGAGQTQNLMSLTWNGSAFVAVQPTDNTGTGIGAVSTRPNALALALDPAGRPWLAVDTTDGTGLQVRAGGTDATQTFVADAQHSIASLLASGQVKPGALILVAATPSDTSLTLDAAAAGVTIYGLDGVSLASGATVAVTGATGLTLRNLIIPGDVTITSTANVTLAENAIGGLVTLDAATGVELRNNALTSVAISTASEGAIHDNAIDGAAVGLNIAAAFSGLIANNSISGFSVAVQYAAGAALANNRIWGAPVGVATDISDAATLFGAVAGSTPNLIINNTVGVRLTNATVVNQTIAYNATGVSGSGLIGGLSSSAYNFIVHNTTGVGQFAGLIDFNRIEENGVGVAATSQLQVFNNLFVANTQNAILVERVHDVQIAGNTIHAYLGDAIHLSDNAYNVEIVSNILWADTGYAIYVANDSQTGFWSDYNTLYATMGGRLVYWTKDFSDILDWQDDVAAFDLHSVGLTVVNPGWAEPHFAPDANGFLVTRPLVAGQRPTDPSLADGDPAGAFIGFNGAPNLLADGDFRAALDPATNWTFTAGGSIVTSGLTPFESTAEFQSGSAANAVLQQTVNLSAYATAIDAGALQVAFGGMVGLLSSAAQAQISVEFFDASNHQIGAAVVVPAGTDLGRWMRTFDTTYAPAGARSVEFLFSVSKTDSSQGALLDAAYLAILNRGFSEPQGVVTSAPVTPGDSLNGRIEITSPDLYQNWVATKPEFITWNSYGAATGKPVTILLMQQTANGLKQIATIASGVSDTGRYSWSPSLSGVAPGTAGLMIRIVSAANSAISATSTEAFAVPVVGSDFYVATAADGGSNRHTGTSADSALPNPVNLFRDYAVGPGQTVHVGAGLFPLITPLTLSGTTDLGFGLEQGFSLIGAAGGGTILTPAIPGAQPRALIDLVGASFVTLSNLTLQGGASGLIVESGSDRFSASNLTSTGASSNAFVITTNNPNGALSGLTATGAGGTGLIFAGSIGAIDNFTAIGDHDGLYANNYPVSTSIGRIKDATFENNVAYGLNATLDGASVIEGSLFQGNAKGVYISGSGVTFGDANLADGLGNVVTASTDLAFEGHGVNVVGNTFSNNQGRNPSVELYNVGLFADNIVSGNSYGAYAWGVTATIQGNFIHDNGVYGLQVSSSKATVTGNTLINNFIGILNTTAGAVFANNVIANDAYAGLQLVSSANVVVSNNTFYEPTAGSVSDANYSYYDTGAIVLDGTSTGARLIDNIVSIGSGVGVFMSDAAQAGFKSNFNLFQTGAGGRVGSWQGLGQGTLAQWRAASAADANSLTGDPLFVSPTGATPDFHVASSQGSFHGGALSVVLGAQGLPVLAGGGYVKDAAISPAVDGGDPTAALGAEPAAAGDIIEIGAYGGTAQASLSPASFLNITAPAAGAHLTQGTSVTVNWNVFNLSGDVNILLSSDGGATFATTIATVAYNNGGSSNTGAYVWTLPGDLNGNDFVLKVQSVADPGVAGVTGVFSAGPQAQIFYVNASATAGGQYSTTPGSDANTGESADAPVASLAALLAKGYTFSPGAVVYIDGGTYNLTQNIVLTAALSGVAFQGPTNGTIATFSRGGTTSGFYDFELNGAKGVTLANLTLTGANIGVSLDDGAGSTGVTVDSSVITANATNVYVGAGDNGFSLTNSTVSAQVGGAGVYLGAAANVTLAKDTINVGKYQNDGVELRGGDDDIIQNNVFIGNSNSALLDINTSTNVLVSGNQFSGPSNYLAYVAGSGLIDSNSFDSSGATHGLEIAGFNTSAVSLTAQNNTIANQIPGNSYGGALIVDNYALGLNNKITNSEVGIRLYNGAARGNDVSGSTAVGILVDYGAAIGNRVHDNKAPGFIMDANGGSAVGNTLWNNPIGFQIGWYGSSYGHTVINNTIVQSTGEALYISNPGAQNTTFEDNILSLTNAVGIVAPVTNQVGFFSDYNLFQIGAGASAATWSGVSIADLNGFKADTALDPNSLSADPKFTNPADDDYTLQAGSPAIDRGDPTLSYFQEPAAPGNGDRINIGAAGGTDAANPSAAQLIQLLGQTGGQRYQIGQTATVSFRSAGLVALDPVLFINPTGGKVVGAQTGNVWQANEYSVANGSVYTTSATVDGGGTTVPESVLQSMLQYTSNNTPVTKYQIPLNDGQYRVTLTFVDTYANEQVGWHVFDILANGATVSAAYDPVQAAGGSQKVSQVTFDVTASGGQGLALGLKPIAGYPLISGIQISRVTNAKTWTATAQVSYDGGANWATLASGLSLNAFGSGAFTFSPTQTTANGLLRIVATDGTSSVSDVSFAPFVSVAQTHDYYIATAANGGSDANDGTSAAKPMASLSALFNLYKLQPGDTVHVGAGVYALPGTIALGASASGTPGAPIVIEGAGASTIFQGPTSGQNLPAIFTLNGAHDVTLKNMALQGGGEGVLVVLNSGATDVTLQSLDISGFTSAGVSVGGGATNFVLTQSNIHDGSDPYAAGLSLDLSNGAAVTKTTFANLYRGAWITNVQTLDASGDTFTNDATGLSASGNYVSGAVTIDDNLVNGGSTGIAVYFSGSPNIVVRGNHVSGLSSDGIATGGVMQVTDNVVTNSATGIDVGAGTVATGNTVSGASQYGIYIERNATVSHNLITANAVGIGMYSGLNTIVNNLLLDNTTYAARISDRTTFDNNTIVQTGGIGLLLQGGGTDVIENNIFAMNGGTVYTIPAQYQSGFSANYNLYDLTGGAVMANWDGASTTATGLAIASVDDWIYGTGEDRNGLQGDPRFKNPNASQPTWDDFVVLPGSRAIDAGDPLSPYGLEPGNNGGRVNLGIEGDTTSANPSAAQAVQILSPAPLGKLQDGVATTITFASSGVTGLQAVARLKFGGAAIPGATQATNYTLVSNSYTNYLSSVDTTNASAPAAVYLSQFYQYKSNNPVIAQNFAVADGDYVLTLNFASYYDGAQTNRTFNIVIDGVTVATNYSAYVAAGNRNNVAVDAKFDVHVTGGQGLNVQLVNTMTSNDYIAICGMEVDRVTATSAQNTALVQVSPDNGKTWETVAAAAPIDAYGNGAVTWTPDFVTKGNVALVKVTLGGATAQVGKFLVANGGNDYYIADGSAGGGQYATAAGDNLNSGKTPDAPMADLAALLRAYKLKAGDVVFVDAGAYTELTAITFDATQSGAAGMPITIQGPTNGGAATLNRPNLNDAVMVFSGGSHIVVNDLTLTGAYGGVDVVDNANSNDIVFNDDAIANNQTYGIYLGSNDVGFTLNASQIYGSVNGNRNTGFWAPNGSNGFITLTNNRIFGQDTGVSIYGDAGLISRNSIYSNNSTGLYYDASGSTPTGMTISNNQIFNNGLTAYAGYGLNINGLVTVSGNTIYGQSASRDVGLNLYYGSTAFGNVIYGNDTGAVVDSASQFTGNRVFLNATAGVNIGSRGSSVLANQIYSNGVGVLGTSNNYASFVLSNNLIYANSAGAIRLGGGGVSGSVNISSNTIWQSTGTAVALSGGMANVTLADNIIWTDVGTLITIAADSLTGFAAISNLYYEGATATPANLVSYGGTVYATLAAWRAGLGSATVATPSGPQAQNAGSLEGDPKFVQMAGADGVLGGPDTPLGGGKDDNFTPSKNSPAIDAGNAILAPATDMLGQGRHDDPGVANTGVGAPIYDAASGPAVAPPAAASGSYISNSGGYAGYYGAYTLPFSFSFYGIVYSTVYVSPTGALFFKATDANVAALAGAPSAANLAATAMIAPFWSTQDTRYYGDGAFVTTSSAGAVNYVTFTFVATPTSGTGSTPASVFAVRLGSDGSVQFEYGANLNGLSAVIGISAGDGANYALASTSGQTNLSNSAAILFTPSATQSRNYTDIGAIEFQGASNNNALPTVVGVTNLPVNNGKTDGVFASLGLQFSSPLNLISALSAANYQLVAAGADGVFGTADDVAIAVTPIYSAATDAVTLTLPGGALADGLYRLTVSGSGQLIDASGNPLNGSGVGDAASPFVRTFTVDRSAIQPPKVTSLAESTPSNATLAITLSAVDPQSLPVVFAIVTPPQHGTIQNFDAQAGTFVYVPDVGYVGNDAIVVSATDSKLAQAQATVSIDVTAYRTAPVASDENAAAIAAVPTTITLQAYDAQIAVARLTLSILSGPAHGTLTVTGQNTVSYVAAAGYAGPDSFRYAWIDNTVTPALTSAPATVSLTVTTVNQPPVTHATTISAVENTPYTFKLSDFPYSDPNNAPATALSAVVIGSLPTSGALSLNGAAVAAGDRIAAADIAAGRLVYTPATGVHGAGAASFVFEVVNSGGVANGGQDASAPATATLDLAEVNQAPTTSNIVLSVAAGGSLTLTSASFPFTDPNIPPQAFAGVVITTLPGAGALTLSGAAVAANQFVSQAQLDAGALVFTPAAHAQGAPYASFGFAVVDAGSTANGGQTTSASATATIDIAAAANQAPTTGPAQITAYENRAYTFQLADFPYSDAANATPTALKAVIVVSLPASGALSLNGVAVVAGQAIAAADLAAGKFVYTPAANQAGATVASFQFRVQNSGGTANGGVDLSAAAQLSIAVSQRQTNSDGTYSITYLAAPGAGYSAYTVLFGADNHPISAVYSNGETSTYHYSGGKLHDIDYQGVVGAAYSSYDVVYGANGKPASATYSDGETTTWTYNADGSLHDVQHGGLSGLGYSSYDVVYDAQGRVASISYSTGASTSYVYNAGGGLHDIAYSGVVGSPYTSYDIVYGADGKPASASYSTGMSASWSYNSNGSLHQVSYAGVVGSPYTSYVVTYDANGRQATATYSDGMTATWTYNADGSTHDVAYAHVTGAPYVSYDVLYGANGKPATETYSNGMTATWTYNADGSTHDVAYAHVTGAAYTSFDVVYGANERPATATYSNGMTATWTYNADGTVHDVAYSHVNGVASTSSDTVYGADGRPVSFVYSFATPGTVQGVAYASSQASFDAKGAPTAVVYFNASHKEVARVDFTSGGKPVFTLGQSDGTGAQPQLAAAEPIVVPPPAVAAPAPAAAIRYDDALVLGPAAASLAPADLKAGLGLAPSRADLASAFFLGGIVLPLAGATAARRKRAALHLFDPIADALIPLGEDDEAPLAMPDDEDDADLFTAP